MYTIPEFVEKRFNTNLKTILAVFWIALFIFVNLTSVLFLGAKALDTIIGTGTGEGIKWFIFGLAFFAAAYSLWGGLSAVAWTDVIQVLLLVLGGLITTIIALNFVTPEGGIGNGLSQWYYWKTLSKSLISYRKSFPVTVALIVYGHHFRKVAKKICKCYARKIPTYSIFHY